MARRAPTDVVQQTEKVETAWEVNAPDVTFGGITLSQMQDKLAARASKAQQLRLAEQRVQTIKDELAAQDLDLWDTDQLVINGIVGNPDFGPDSPLYGDTGRVRKSQRKTGKTNKHLLKTTPRTTRGKVVEAPAAPQESYNGARVNGHAALNGG